MREERRVYGCPKGEKEKESPPRRFWCSIKGKRKACPGKGGVVHFLSFLHRERRGGKRKMASLLSSNVRGGGSLTATSDFHLRGKKKRGKNMWTSAMSTFILGGKGMDSSSSYIIEGGKRGKKGERIPRSATVNGREEDRPHRREQQQQPYY